MQICVCGINRTATDLRVLPRTDAGRSTQQTEVSRSNARVNTWQMQANFLQVACGKWHVAVGSWLKKATACMASK